MVTLDLVRARSVRTGDRLVLAGRGRTSWLVKGSYVRCDGMWGIVCKRGKETNVLRVSPQSWLDKVG